MSWCWVVSVFVFVSVIVEFEFSIVVAGGFVSDKTLNLQDLLFFLKFC